MSSLPGSAPPAGVALEDDRAVLRVELLHLVRARTPLVVRVVHVALVVDGGVGGRGVDQHVEQALPPHVDPLEGHDGLPVVDPPHHRGDPVVAVGGAHQVGGILAVAGLPGGLERAPVDRRAVVVGGLRVDRVGDSGVPVDRFLLDVGQVVRVVHRVAVGGEGDQDRVVPPPQGERVARAVGLERVELRRDLGERRGQGAAVLEVLVGLGVVLRLLGERLRGLTGRPPPCPEPPLQATSATQSTATAASAVLLVKVLARVLASGSTVRQHVRPRVVSGSGRRCDGPRSPLRSARGSRCGSGRGRASSRVRCSGQRLTNLHPGDGSVGLGRSPRSSTRARVRSTCGSGTGTAESRAWV